MCLDDVEAELIRYKEATNIAIEQLKELAEKALLEMGEEGANIFGGHQLLLTDVGYQQMVCELLQEEKVTAEAEQSGEDFMFSPDHHGGSADGRDPANQAAQHRKHDQPERSHERARRKRGAVDPQLFRMRDREILEIGGILRYGRDLLQSGHVLRKRPSRRRTAIGAKSDFRTDRHTANCTKT